MIYQLQDVSTPRSLSTAYRHCTQLTKTLGSKRPAVDISLIVVFLLKKEFGILIYLACVCMCVHICGEWVVVSSCMACSAWSGGEVQSLLPDREWGMID